MNEQIIVTLTTWSRRIKNIPIVLDTIYNQTMRPDLVVLNLATDEHIPADVQKYLDKHQIEVNYVPDTKVYKKLIPTLKRYPSACVISIDDDWLYPKEMIADFINIHKLFPSLPISGNNVALFGLQCHCGCASLTKADYFGKYLECIDDEVIANCPSDDIVYTFFSSLAGHPYVRSTKRYFLNMTPFGQEEGYTATNHVLQESISRSYNYLTKRFGIVPSPYQYYLDDTYLADLFADISSKSIKEVTEITKKETEDRIYASRAFRLGKAILKPFSWVKYKIINN